jgi:hypothetical protein
MVQIFGFKIDRGQRSSPKGQVTVPRVERRKSVNPDCIYAQNILVELVHQGSHHPASVLQKKLVIITSG